MVRFVPWGVTEFGKHLIDLENDGSTIKLTFKDGTLAQASAVLASDRVRSLARRMNLP
jgi:hypothetical protein